MGWDVFISHASEDKATVAIPLKEALERLGISVWIDIDQIALGDSFRSKIDGGLQHCRFGVVILSPRFFEKPWAQAEMDALMNMEMSAANEKRLLPILHDMSFAEINQHSPLIASRLATNWDRGKEAVAEAIAAAVLKASTSHAATAAPRPPSIHTSGPLDALILFLLPDGRMLYAESTEVESRADESRLTIKCADAETAAMIREFDRDRSGLVAIAFGDTAVIGRITEAVLRRSGTDQIGSMTLRHEPSGGGVMMEMAFHNVSADQIAEMRARRILLNERNSPGPQWPAGDVINRKLLDYFIAGQGGFLKVEESPLSPIYH